MKYSVVVTRTREEIAEFEVSAKTEEAAIEKVRAKLEDSENGSSDKLFNSHLSESAMTEDNYEYEATEG